MPDTRLPRRLLAANDPAPFTVYRPDGVSPFLLTCDHAGRAVPRRWATSACRRAEWERHIAWDIGAAGMARVIADTLDAWLICQTYSRLVIDCNRPFGSPGSIATRSEHTDVPGNRDLVRRRRSRRVAARSSRRTTSAPWRSWIAARAAGRPTILVTVHSFTPVFMGSARPWQLGVLYQRDARLAHPLLEVMRADGWSVGDNQPYAVSDASDYAIPGVRRTAWPAACGTGGAPGPDRERGGPARWGERIAAMAGARRPLARAWPTTMRPRSRL